MSLQDWLKSLENQNGQGEVPANIRCREILRCLNLDKFCPIITIGGTNGKGSTTYFLAAYAQAMGQKVGRFTSPHLMKYNERIAINGENIAEAEILAAFEKIKVVQGNMYLGYFDYSFLAAFLIFAKAQVNLIILEVGLGGRLDATNAVDTDCAILTTIAFDHMALLGDTRDAIGFEKAGIFRAGKIAICGDENTPHSVRNHAKAIGARFFERSQNFDLNKINLKNLPVPHFPRQNALTALQAILCLDAEKILEFNEALIYETLKTLHIPGRMQVLQNQPKIIVDVAHNQESVGYLVNYLKRNPASGSMHAVFSALQDKEIDKMMQLCDGVFAEWSLVKLDHPRAATREILLSGVPDFALAHYFDSIEALMRSLLQKVSRQDQIIIFGSFFIVNLFLNWYYANKNMEFS